MAGDIFESTLNQIDATTYPVLSRYGRLMGQDGTLPVIGRDAELKELRANLARPLVGNVLLLGDAGVGKTAIVESYATFIAPKKKKYVYEIDLIAMAERGADSFNALLKNLVDEVQRLDHESSYDYILFMDETHSLPKLGATDAIKPVLARGAVRIIGATTYEEYVTYIKPNQALDRRFQQLVIDAPDKRTIVKILRQILNRKAPTVTHSVSDGLLFKIVDYGKYQPAMSQPNKSIDLLDAMIGDHIEFNTPLNKALLNEKLSRKTGVQADWDVDIDTVIKNAKHRVRGQDVAIDLIRDNLEIATAGLQDPTRPMGSFLFVGSTGVGKTELVKSLASSLFGTEDAMIRFDMSEYQTIESVPLFQERVSNALLQRPYTILLLDEMEKGHPGTRDLLLQILDDGRLSDQYGRQISALNAYIVMTSNLGVDTITDAASNDADVRQYQRLLFSELALQLRPEFLGRISAIVPFTSLSPKTLVSITRIHMAKLQKMLKSKGVQLAFESEKSSFIDVFYNETVTTYRLFDYLVRDNVSKDPNQGGGRALNNRINAEVIAPIASLLNRDPSVSVISIGVSGKMVSDDLFDSRGNAHVVVRKIK